MSAIGTTSTPAPPDSTGSGPAGSGLAGSGVAGSGRAGSGAAGSAPAGPGELGPVEVWQSLRARWRRWRWVLLIALLILATAVITALTVPHAGDTDRLGPDNPAPQGSRALAQILLRQGVNVQPRTDSRQAVAATDGRSTLLVTSTQFLAPEQLDRLAADDSADLVLIEPDELALAKLVPDVHTLDLADPAVRDPGCDVPAAVRAGNVRAGGLIYGFADEPAVGVSAAAVCYPQEAGRQSGSYLVQIQSGRKVTVIGQSDLLTNEYLGRRGNAALALATLGEQPTLVWYSPDLFEPTGAPPRATVTDLLPDWVHWVEIQLLVVVLIAMLWRARRLGRLVPEPLPVVVRAAETQEGRARLYRQASARGRVAATLRTTALRRLATSLAAPSGTTPEQLVTLVAGATGRNEPQVGALLLGSAPGSDGALVRLADDLDALQQDLSARSGRTAQGNTPGNNRPARST